MSQSPPPDLLSISITPALLHFVKQYQQRHQLADQSAVFTQALYALREAEARLNPVLLEATDAPGGFDGLEGNGSEWL
jgi:hypothetical protein